VAPMVASAARTPTAMMVRGLAGRTTSSGIGQGELPMLG
jgi:hypothetical protein